MDTQLGENDFGYYEIPKQNLGQGYGILSMSGHGTPMPTLR